MGIRIISHLRDYRREINHMATRWGWSCIHLNITFILPLSSVAEVIDKGVAVFEIKFHPEIHHFAAMLSWAIEQVRSLYFQLLFCYFISCLCFSLSFLLFTFRSFVLIHPAFQSIANAAASWWCRVGKKCHRFWNECTCHSHWLNIFL